MGESRILTTEEVDAILKASQEQSQDLSSLISNETITKQGKQYSYGLVNIHELTRSELEKNLSSFLRKKILVKSLSFNSSRLTASIGDTAGKKVYSIFRIMPQDYFGIFVLDLVFLHQAINLLYGGKINKNETTFTNPGKIGTIISDKICQLFLTSFSKACEEYGEIICDVLKTTPLLNIVTNMGITDEDPIILMDLALLIDDIESTFKIILLEDFLSNFIPIRKEESRHREKDFWKTAIKSQVVDSLVNVSIALPDVTMKVNEFMSLKEGDLIPISDPTLVYVCLNNIKLFRANAGQANNKRVAKIISQI